ncbi:hypothetical protein [Ideonella sp.]|uniref:hypothetical protein n=1 Tax=Ideonella sp. TaxID=1929293 RepID=UPI0035B27DC6
MKTIHAILAAAVAASLIPVAAQAAPTYQLIRLDSFGGSIAIGLALNESGTVVGKAHTMPCCDDDAPYETRRAVRWTASNPTDLGTLGGMNATATGINDQNVVIGASTLAGGGNDVATTWVNGLATQLPNLGGQASGAYAINRRGDIAGYATTAGNVRYRAVVWRAGVARALPDLGGKNAVATALSNKGHVVGYSTARGQQGTRAVMWSSAGGLTNLGAGLAGSSNARGVNDNGTAVGYHIAPGAYSRPIIWSGTTPVDVGTLGGAQGWVNGINNQGSAVGASSKVGTETPHATLWQAGAVLDLNDLVDPSQLDPNEWLLTEAMAINGRGEITGVMRNVWGFEQRGFLLKPLLQH